VARDTVLRVFPGAQVETKCVREHPLMVSVEHRSAAGGGSTVVWKGRQQGLFRKNGHPAIPEIEQGLKALKGTLGLAARRASLEAMEQM